MKISYNWLSELISIPLTPEKIDELLTGCGLEVEGIEKYESVKGGLKGIVVGAVKNCEKHPNADKLSITTVDIGLPEPLHIVCGAPNVRAGQKVLIATVGTTVYPIKGEPFEIKKAKIRGEVSEGMICAEDELSLGESHDGILVLPADCKVGEKAITYFPVYEDYLIEIGLTANRGDAASHLGVARDLRALTNCEIMVSDDELVSAKKEFPVTVEVEDIEGCMRYSGISISGVQVNESPEWMKNRLKTIGLNPINNIVDATNYVLHELGQPLHAFDADSIAGNRIKVKKLPKETRCITLDKEERKLTGTECMICDDADVPLAIGGVFGCLGLGITSATKNIFIESAYFNPASIRKTAKQHGLNTDASFRFERGTDPNMTLKALKRVSNLILEIAGGQISSGVIDVYPEPIEDTEIMFSISRLTKLIGQQIPLDEIKRILPALDIKINQESETHLGLSVPPYRSDVKREADVAEEILRIYGLNNIAIPEQLKSTLTKSADENAFLLRNKAADYLSSNGFNEMLSNSLTKSAYYDDEELKAAVKMLNPLSNDLDILRMDMLFNGLEMIQYNANRKMADLKSFEFGHTYRKEGNIYRETPHIAIFITGKKSAESWYESQKEATYFTLKSVVSNVIARVGLHHLSFEYIEDSKRLTQRTCVLFKKKPVAEFGQVKVELTKLFDISQPVFFGDILWNEVKMLTAENKFNLNPVSAFPQVKRDLALLIDQSVRYADIEKIALKTEPALIKSINAFDVYEGDKLEKGKKSYAVSFILQDDAKTLTDQEIEDVMKKLIANYQKELGASLRG